MFRVVRQFFTMTHEIVIRNGQDVESEVRGVIDHLPIGVDHIVEGIVTGMDMYVSFETQRFSFLGRVQCLFYIRYS